MARSGDGEASRKRLGLSETGAKYERAKKKARATENISKVSRKRAWDEVTETESQNDSPSRKVSRVGSTKKNDTQESVNTGDVQGPNISQRKWKRTPKIAISEPSGSCLREAPEENLKEGKPKQIRENEVVRKVLQTVHLEESQSNIGLENESAGIVSSLEQTALRDRKRRESNKGEESQPKKKLRIEDPGAEASHRNEEGVTYTNTWKRLKRDDTGNSGAPAASEDMGVSISEAWKRLRDEKDTATTSGTSVNGRSDSDLSMHSVPEWVEERLKKARYDEPPVLRKWKRQNREKKQSSSSKRQRDHGAGCESSGSSGSDMAQSSYLHNRKWKRPRYENLMSVQGRSLRSRDGEEKGRKTVKGDASERPTKLPRK